MKTKLIILLSTIMLGACTPSYKSMDYPIRPEELKDCGFYGLRNSLGDHITVVRCPNSTTTSRAGGKHDREVVVIDGVEYTKKEK